jgi:transglutaminase-like putative cysteine protease
VSRSGSVQGAAVLAPLLVAASLSTLVEGVMWFLEVVLVVGALALAGFGARRVARHPVVPVLAQLAALLLMLTWLFAGPEALLGLVPGVGSTARLLQVGADGLQVTREVAAPAPAEAGVLLLVTAGIGAVALLVDLLAVGLRRPAVAGLPLLAVYCVPAALARGGLDWYWFVLAGAGYLVLVASDAGDRVSRWGRVLHGRGGEAAPMAATGRRVGALALGAALVVPTVVPGLGEGLLFGRGVGDGPGAGGTIRVVNPIFSLRSDLSAQENVPVLSYETTGTPQPLRIVTVDSFDGDQWAPTLGTIPRSQDATGDLPAPRGLSSGVSAREQRYRISIDSLEQRYLPVPYPPTRIDILGPWLYDEGTLNIIGDDVTTEPGMSYDVRYLDVQPTPEQLLAAPAAPADVVERWGHLPDGVPQVLLDTARAQGGEGTAYEQAVRLQAFFRSNGGFQYSTRAPDANSASALADFLQSRSGYCVHFASAMAVMARALGIPARVAVGFLPGNRLPDDSYQVNIRDAHAWPELFFSGVGWVRFEPTPQTRTGALPGWAAPPPALTDDAVPTDQPSGQAVPTDTPSRPSTAPDRAPEEDRSLADVLAAMPWRLLAALALVLAAAAAPAVTAALVRRRRWRRAGHRAAEVAEAAWTTLAERVRDLRVPFPASATPRQAEQHLAEGLDDGAQGALHRIARAVERARYAPTPPSADGLRADVRTVVAAVADRRPSSFTWRARLLPASGVEHLRGALVDAGLALDRSERRLAARARHGLRRLAPTRG